MATTNSQLPSTVGTMVVNSILWNVSTGCAFMTVKQYITICIVTNTLKLSVYPSYQDCF